MFRPASNLLPLNAFSPIDFNLLLNLIEIKSQSTNAKSPIVSSVSGNSRINCLPLNTPQNVSAEIPFILRLGSNFTLIIFPAVFRTFMPVSGILEYAIPSLTSTLELSRMIVASSLTSALATTG